MVPLVIYNANVIRFMAQSYVRHGLHLRSICEVDRPLGTTVISNVYLVLRSSNYGAMFSEINGWVHNLPI